jgi:Fic-DOC domain mobile mystery protein B
VVVGTVSLFEGPPGPTPLDSDEQEGLIPTWIGTRGDLDTAEQANIAAASLWVGTRSWEPADLTQGWLRDLHRRMFDRVWRWAGTYRRGETNLGVAPAEIAQSVETLVRDMRAQIGGPWSTDEIAMRFHHRLVWIHPFPNGNGRHARLAADALVRSMGAPSFSWGAGLSLDDAGPVRAAYLDALRVADLDGDVGPLLRFARS